MEKKDDVFYVLFYLNNWDFYGTYMDSAPLPESRKNKYNEIMDRFQHREIDGSGVTSELASWLINFDTNNRKKFLDWVAEKRSIQTTKMTKKESLEQINQVFARVFGKDLAKEIWFNGHRAEGCSLIIVDSVWSYQMAALMAALNEVPGLFELPFGEWRVRKATPNYIVNQNVPRDVRDNCYEVRLIFKDFYHRM